MNKKISSLTICYILFLILLILFGLLPGILPRVCYPLAGILPTLICIFLTKGEWKGEKSRFLTLKKEDTGRTLPLIAPTVGLIILVSFATSWLIFSITGKENHVNVGDSLILALINHALLPTLVEETLFRYLPMRLLSSHSRRATVFISAFFFALAHRSLFSIPYAFLAGVIFMAIDLAADSIIPSVLIHFINNAISVGILFYGDNPAFTPAVLVILGIFSLVSLIVIVLRRKEYLRMLTVAFSAGETPKFSFEMLIFAGLTLSMAVMNLL